MKKNILVVEDSVNLLKSIQNAFKKYEEEMNLLIAENGEEAINILQERDVSVLVTDLYMPEVDGLELLAYMTQHHHDVPCIVMSAFSSPEISGILTDLGTYRFLEKPFELTALLNAITDAVNDLEAGKPLARISIASCLRLLEEEQRSCTVETFSLDGLEGFFHLIDGRLYDAKCDELAGENAAITILARDNFAFNLTNLPSDKIKAVIPLGLNALLAKASEVNGNNGKAIKDQPTNGGKEKNSQELLCQAIRYAESGDAISAHRILTGILKNNPNNSKAWLWFARTTENFRVIRVALQNASIISPDDPEIALEIQNQKKRITSAENPSGHDQTRVDGHGIRLKSILVVEDSATTRTVIRKILTPRGYNIIEANDGIEAIAKFKEKTPDLILLDIIMPCMDGYQTLAVLRKDHDLSKIPIIMLTAKDSLLDKLRGKMSGSTEYLTKPFNAFELINKVGEYLN